MGSRNIPKRAAQKCSFGDPYAHDESVRKNGFGLIAGVDESGRGPLAGPVVAAAVALPQGIVIQGVRDSKIVPAAERERLFWEIMDHAVDVGVGIVDAEEIDRINILCATKLAMHNAITALANRPDIILIDALQLPSIPIRQMPLIKGDAKSAAIAAASIIAKVIRDKIMAEYHILYPRYGFDRHKGYGTRKHLESIREHGPCPIHRKSFRKVLPLELPF